MTGGILLCILLLFLILMILKVTKSGESLGKKDISFPDRVATLENFDTGGITKYGWLQIEGTMIDLPILSPYTEGNIDYNYGWISPSSIGKKNRKVLIGHNVLNVSNHPMLNESILTDFEDLMAFVYYNFAKEHMYLSYTENGENHIFVIYGIGFYNYDLTQKKK